MAFYHASAALGITATGTTPIEGTAVLKWLAGRFNMAGTWLMRIAWKFKQRRTGFSRPHTFSAHRRQPWQCANPRAV
jgi:hypothetical protein